MKNQKPLTIYKNKTKEEQKETLHKLIKSRPDGYSLQEISEIIGISVERVRQIKHKALRNFRKQFINIQKKNNEKKN